MPQLQDSRVTGPQPLQHQNWVSTGFDEDLRASVYAVRILDRFDKPGDPLHLGWWRPEPDTLGDIHGGQLFRHNAARSVSMWRHSWPVITAKGGGTVASGGGGGGKGGPGGAGAIAHDPGKSVV